MKPADAERIMADLRSVGGLVDVLVQPGQEKAAVRKEALKTLRSIEKRIKEEPE